MTTERECRSFRILSGRRKMSRLRFAPRSGKYDAQLSIACPPTVATVPPSTHSGGSNADAVSSRDSVQSWSAGSSHDRSRDGRLEGSRLDPISPSSRSAVKSASGREAQSQGHRAVANPFRAGRNAPQELPNVCLLLSDWLAAQSVLRPLCSRRPSAAEAHVGLMREAEPMPAQVDLG
jgi:hypothetical protein